MLKQIEILNNEYWWGGVVDDAYLMPLTKNSVYKLDLTTNTTYNQGASLFLSNLGRYVWSDSGAIFKFENGIITVESKSEINVDDSGKNLKEAYLNASGKHFPFDGTYPDEEMILVPQYCTWIDLLDAQTEDNILSFAESILANGMPAGEIIIDNGWQTDYGNWTFNKAKFSNPAGMIEKLHKMGFKVIMWVAPYISPDSHIFGRLVEKGGLIRELNGKPYILEWWEGFSGVIDMTNPVDVEYFSSALKALSDLGVDGFKQDGGDGRFFERPFKTYAESDANRQCELYAQFAKQFPFNEIRACFKCGGQGLAQRITDRHHSWDIKEGLKSLIPNITMQGLLGYAYTCPDMVGGGLSGDFMNKTPEQLDRELFIRSCQCSSLMPMMQLSYAFWRVFDAETVNICIKHTLLHAEMHEEIMKLVVRASKTGEPIVRNMAYEFDALYEDKTQFCLGSDYLIAPVLNSGERKRKVTFPKYRWECMNTGKVYESGEYEIEAPLNTLLWFKKVRQGV